MFLLQGKMIQLSLEQIMFHWSQLLHTLDARRSLKIINGIQTKVLLVMCRSDATRPGKKTKVGSVCPRYTGWVQLKLEPFFMLPGAQLRVPTDLESFEVSIKAPKDLMLRLGFYRSSFR
jgi:hypothetical protein